MQISPSDGRPSWPDRWKAQAKGMLVGAEGMKAAVAYAAANNAPLVWADDLAGDSTGLAPLVAQGWIVALHDTALLVEGKVDCKLVAALPSGALVIGYAENAKLFDRAGLSALEP